MSANPKNSAAPQASGAVTHEIVKAPTNVVDGAGAVKAPAVSAPAEQLADAQTEAAATNPTVATDVQDWPPTHYLPPLDKTWNPQLQAAHLFIRLGWSFFPCHGIKDGRCACGRAKCNSPGKHPATKKGCNDAMSVFGLAMIWWNPGFPHEGGNIAIATGSKSKIWVLDVDGEIGEASLRAIEQEIGPLPRTVEALTGGGGRHIYFANPHGDIPCSTAIRPGLDVRAEGGYVVAPPSKHISGRIYYWEADHHPEDVPLAEAPPRLVEIAKAGRPKEETKKIGKKGGKRTRKSTAPIL